MILLTEARLSAFAPFVKGGGKARQRLGGDLLFAPRANPPSSALRMPAPFCKGGIVPACLLASSNLAPSNRAAA